MSEQTQPTKETTFRQDGEHLLAGVIEATEESREAQRMKNALNMAQLLSRVTALSGLPAGAKPEQIEQAKYEAFAKMEIGWELGLQPAESLRAVFFGQNGPDIEIHTRVALAMRSGRYKFDIVRLDQNQCEVQWYRHVRGSLDGRWEKLAPLKVTIEQLKGIKVYEKGKQIALADKWNYQSWREDMMYAYLQRRAVRRYAPETQGSFVPAPADEEMYEEAGIHEGEMMTAEKAATIRTELSGVDDDAFTRQVRNTGYVPQGVDPQTGEVLDDDIPQDVVDADAEWTKVQQEAHGEAKQGTLLETEAMPAKTKEPY